MANDNLEFRPEQFGLGGDAKQQNKRGPNKKNSPPTVQPIKLPDVSTSAERTEAIKVAMLSSQKALYESIRSQLETIKISRAAEETEVPLPPGLPRMPLPQLRPPEYVSSGVSPLGLVEIPPDDVERQKMIIFDTLRRAFLILKDSGVVEDDVLILKRDLSNKDIGTAIRFVYRPFSSWEDFEKQYSDYQRELFRLKPGQLNHTELEKMLSENLRQIRGAKGYILSHRAFSLGQSPNLPIFINMQSRSVQSLVDAHTRNVSEYKKLFDLLWSALVGHENWHVVRHDPNEVGGYSYENKILSKLRFRIETILSQLEAMGIRFNLDDYIETNRKLGEQISKAERK